MQMLDVNRMVTRLQNLPSWWIGVLLAVGFLATSIGFETRTAYLGRQVEQWEYEANPAQRAEAGCTLEGPIERKSFDGRSLGYTSDDAECWLTAIGEDGRRVYRITQGSLDAVFPFAYALLFAILLARAGQRDFECYAWLSWMVLLPLAAGAFDLAEGLLTILLATSDPAHLSKTLVSVASVCTVAKSFALMGSLIALPILGRRSLGTLFQRLLLTRVPLLGLVVISLLPILATRGVPTIENAFITGSSGQLRISAFVSVLAVLLLGHAFLVAWQLAHERFEVVRLPLPLFQHSGLPDVRRLAMTGGLAAVLLLPLLWSFYRKATDGVVVVPWALFGLLLGVAGALLVVVGTVWLVLRIRAQRGSGSKGPLDHLLCRLGPGYWDATADRALPGHKLSFALAALLAVVYLFFYGWYSPEDTGRMPSALAFVILWITLLSLILAGVAFFLDRWRVPLLLAVLIYVSVWNVLEPRAHEFEIFPRADNEVRNQIPLDPKGVKTLTVIAADGGGIQAAAWSAHVLTGLQEVLGDGFTDSVRFISSVSGGSVGVYFYLEAAAHDAANGPKASSRECVRRAAAASSLEATAWGLLGPDFRRLVFPLGLDNTRDRGWALERAFVHTAARMREAIERSEAGGTKCADHFDELANERSAGDESRLSEWRTAVHAGKLPGMAFNSTFVDNGEQAFFTTVDPSSVGCDKRQPCWPFGHLDLRVATAARLSATFPYVTPIARPSLDGLSEDEQKEVGKWSVADGGYFDNFGSFAAIQWLRSQREALQEAEIEKVVFLQILTFPATETVPPSGSEGLVDSIAGPLKALLAVRTSSQLKRNRVELDLLEQVFAGEGPEVISVELRPPPLPNHEAPLSWHLSDENVLAIEEQWRLVCETQLGELREVFGAEASCPRAPTSSAVSP